MEDSLFEQQLMKLARIKPPAALAERIYRSHTGKAVRKESGRRLWIALLTMAAVAAFAVVYLVTRPDTANRETSVPNGNSAHTAQADFVCKDIRGAVKVRNKQRAWMSFSPQTELRYGSEFLLEQGAALTLELPSVGGITASAESVFSLDADSSGRPFVLLRYGKLECEIAAEQTFFVTTFPGEVVLKTGRFQISAADRMVPTSHQQQIGGETMKKYLYGGLVAATLMVSSIVGDATVKSVYGDETVLKPGDESAVKTVRDEKDAIGPAYKALLEWVEGQLEAKYNENMKDVQQLLKAAAEAEKSGDTREADTLRTKAKIEEEYILNERISNMEKATDLINKAVMTPYANENGTFTVQFEYSQSNASRTPTVLLEAAVLVTAEGQIEHVSCTKLAGIVD